jgi:hypothetical protein
MRILQDACDYEFFNLAKTRLYKEVWVVFNPKTHNYISHVCILTRVDVVDEYFQLAKNMVMEWMKQFVHVGNH